MVTENELAGLPFLLSGKEVRRIFGLGSGKGQRTGARNRGETVT